MDCRAGLNSELGRMLIRRRLLTLARPVINKASNSVLVVTYTSLNVAT